MTGVLEISKSSKSEIYRDVMPLMTGRQIELPDKAVHPLMNRLIDQFVSLERRSDNNIDAAANAPEDVANAVAGACVLAATKPRLGVSVGSACITPRGVIINEGIRYAA